MMKFVGNISQGRLTLSVSQNALRKNYLQNLKDGTQISEEIKPIRKGKTHQQVKAIFGLALATVKAEFDDRGWDTSFLYNLSIPTGIEVSVNMLKEYFYGVCPIYSEEGQRITLSHKDCDTKAASNFLEEVRNWSASQWGIYIAEPNPDWKEENGKETKKTE